MKFLCNVFFLLSSTVSIANPVTIALWAEKPMLYYKPSEVHEYSQACWQQKLCVYNVVNPTLTLYPAQNTPTGKAVIVLPGGGYTTQAITHEGHEVAEALSQRGITAAVLKYRLPNPLTSTQPEMTPLADVREAIAYLRKNSKPHGITSHRIGVLGFSAGAHLATVASLWTSSSVLENPDFSLLIYGVTRFNAENKQWLEDSLYFRPLTPEETQRNTLLKLVRKQTPPAFLVHAMDDDVCHYSESTLYAQALTQQGVEAETHLFATGGHGFGLGNKEDGTSQWIDLAANWIKRR